MPDPTPAAPASAPEAVTASAVSPKAAFTASVTALLGLFAHYDSKKLASVVKTIFAEFMVLGLSIANAKWQLGVDQGTIVAAAVSIAGVAATQIIGQSVVDAKTEGATSGIVKKEGPP